MKLLPMIAISFVSGLLSSMSVWADTWSDMKLSLNDVYMSSLMTGWMILLSGVWMKDSLWLLLGIVLVGLSLVAIRTQCFIGVGQYVQGMIPHHSMAIFMSKRLIERYGPSVLGGLPAKIVEGQRQEISYLQSVN